MTSKQSPVRNGADQVRPAAKRGRPPGRPRDTDSQETRLAVLEAAVVQFSRTGFAGTSTRMICEQAGVTAATVYHHFGSKRALYVEALNHGMTFVYTRFEHAVKGKRSLRAELHAILDCALGNLEHHHEITELAIRAQSDLSHEELRANYPPSSRSFLDGVIARAVERGELRARDAWQLELTIDGMLWGLSIVGQDERTRVGFVTAFERLIDGDLFKPPGTRQRPSRRQVRTTSG
ncbi:MAG: TetR/AcrR family transcriptional regulator [Ilumatobacteraceae bacterium]